MVIVPLGPLRLVVPLSVGTASVGLILNVPFTVPWSLTVPRAENDPTRRPLHGQPLTDIAR
jgi:hypothetical protein